MKSTSDSEQAAVLLPEILAHRRDGDSVTLSLSIPENLSYFRGHFDRIPIVPGVVQIQWAAHFAREHLGLGGAFSHMEAVKFKELLLSGRPLLLHLRYDAQAGKLTFQYQCESAEYSSGRIYFRDDRV